MLWIYQIIAGLSFTSVVKALCMAGNVLVQVSPFPQVKRWEHRGCTGEADAAPYVSIAFGGWQWCYYGLFAWLLTKRSGFLILVHSNFLGAILGTYYTVTFFRNCRNDAARQNIHLYFSAVLSLVLLQACAVAVLPEERALFLTGLVSSFCSFVGAISMLVTLPAVIRTQDSRAIPGPLCLANLMSSLVWCLCGWMLADPLIAAPNIAAAISSSACVYLKIRYPSDDALLGSGELCSAPPRRAWKHEPAPPPPTKTWTKPSASEFTPLLGAACRAEAVPSKETHFSDDTGGTF